MSMTGNKSISRHIFTGVYVGVVIAVVLAIVGGATATYSPFLFQAKTESKVAIVILIALFMTLVLVNALLLFRLRHLPQGERLPLLAITAGSPFFTSRLAYACTSAYKVSQTFNPLVGNVWVLAFMSVFEEFVVALLYSFASMKTPLGKGTSNESSRGPSTLDLPSGEPSGDSTTTDKKSQCTLVASGGQGASMEIEKTEVEMEEAQENPCDVGIYTRDAVHKQSKEDLEGKKKALVELHNTKLETESLSRGRSIIGSEHCHVLQDTKHEVDVTDAPATVDSKALAVDEGNGSGYEAESSPSN